MAPTCLDNSTASINAIVESNENYTAQMMIDMIEENIQEKHPLMMHLKSGWVLCLSPDCEWKSVNDTALKVSSDSHPLPLIVGLVVGVTCVLIVILLCIVVIIWMVHKR